MVLRPVGQSTLKYWLNQTLSSVGISRLLQSSKNFRCVFHSRYSHISMLARLPVSADTVCSPSLLQVPDCVSLLGFSDPLHIDFKEKLPYAAGLWNYPTRGGPGSHVCGQSLTSKAHYPLPPECPEDTDWPEKLCFTGQKSMNCPV